MKLVIAEKPSVGKTIANVIGADKAEKGYMIGNGYIVSWCFGHLVGLDSPESYGDQFKTWSFDNLPIIPDNYNFSINSSSSSQFYLLKKLMFEKDVDELIEATDAGREGECIFRYVYNMAGCKKPFKRLWTSSLEESAIRKGFRDLKDSSYYDDLYSAGLCRAKADWLVGMNFTRLFTVRYSSKVLNIGRVQTPTLAMIVTRDDAIKNFVREKYYTVDIGTPDCPFFASGDKIKDKDLADSILKEVLKKGDAVVEDVTNKKMSVSAPRLYDLTTLQREANRFYGFTAQKTLDLTQALYEKKLVTYPRTDSQYITADMKNTFLKLIGIAKEKTHIESDHVNADIVINDAKVSDHTALLITEESGNTDLSSLSDDERKIFELIAVRMIASSSLPYKYIKTIVKLRSGEHIFTGTGRSVEDYGWKKIVKNVSEDDDKERELPYFTKGQVLSDISGRVSEHFTTSPKSYTEDTLLSAMETAGNKDYNDSKDIEKKGLGTPATRAGIIEQLVRHGFVERNKKSLSATGKGHSLIAVVPEEIKSPSMTAEWENSLQNIEKGRSKDTEFMSDIESYVRNTVNKYNSKEKNTMLSDSKKVIGKCPLCGGDVVDYSKSYSCSNWKEKGCKFVIWKNICGKKVSESNAVKLLNEGRTDTIKGFRSKKTGKQFDARLKLDGECKVVFDFS